MISRVFLQEKQQQEIKNKDEKFKIVCFNVHCYAILFGCLLAFSIEIYNIHDRYLER